MSPQPLLKIDPRAEVESQIDAMFAPAFSLVDAPHHKLLARLEQDMISAVKSAMRLPATEPVKPNPIYWPWSSGDRLAVFLPPKERGELLEIRKRRRAK